MKKIFELSTTIVYLLSAILLAVIAMTIMGWSVYDAYQSSYAITDGQSFILAMLQAVSSIIIGVAIVDVSKYIIEEEVLRSKELRHPKEARRTITKIMVIIAIVVGIEGLVYIFKAGTQDVALLIYPCMLILSSTCVIVGLGVYQKLSVSLEDDIE